MKKKYFFNTGEILKIVNLRGLPEYIQSNSGKSLKNGISCKFLLAL